MTDLFIGRALLERVLARTMKTGADFAEIFAESTRRNSLYMIDGRIESASDSTISGVGLRAFKGLRCVSASTSDLTESGLMRAAAQVADIISEGNEEVKIHLRERINADIHPVAVVPDSEYKSVKAEILKRGVNAASAYDKAIVQASGNLLDVDRHILIANSDGLLTSDRQVRTRLAISAVAEKNGDRQSGFDGPGRRMGLEMFDTVSPEKSGEEAARSATVKLGAAYCPAGKMTVAIANGFGGVIFHEACGHSLEATAVARGASQMAGKLGQRVASEKVTAVDDGTIPGAWGSMNIDDEGTPARRNVLIEKGILRSYMIDRFNGRRMGMESTGSRRRESYEYEPTSRMTNTFLLNGEETKEEIIASMDYGLYAAKMGGGSVSPVTGAFNFSVGEGYIVRNGKICEPVKGASLIGTGSEILMNIDMVGQDLKTGQGMCGSSSGQIPTDVGQPMIRVSSITVGGRT